ncbi:MAG: hypothetical protein H7Z16_11185 [Pyrinomonadaceae bacterium]|nr:hypothetical protein [Pyrinomonadaceae bacterium]
MHWELRSHLLTEIGVAGVVAIILAMTIEYVARKRDERRFREEKEAIKNDVFEHVLGYRLPKGTFAELDNQILRASFIRRDFRCSYTLVPIKVGTTKFMKIEATWTYEIVNRTPERQPYLFRTMVEKAPVEELDPLVKFTCVNVKGCQVPLTLDSADACKEEAKDNIRPNHWVIEKQISIVGATHASVVVSFEAVRVFEGGVSFLLHSLQTEGFSLKVTAPPEVEVSASPFLPESLGEGAEHQLSRNRYHWVLNNPILPYQGVYVTWKSKAAEPRPSAAVGKMNAPGNQDEGKANTRA